MSLEQMIEQATARGQLRFPVWRLVAYLDPNMKFELPLEDAAD